ncbi:MAG: lipocalin family protein [Planctomycetota bacterium]
MHPRLLLLPMLLVLLGAAPAEVRARAVALEDVEVVGRWQLTTILINDEPIEDDDIGRRVIVFYADGTMKAYDGDMDQPEDDYGTYQLEGDEMSMTEDGSDITEVYKVARSENQFSLTQQLDEDNKLVIVLTYLGQTEEH